MPTPIDTRNKILLTGLEKRMLEHQSTFAFCYTIEPDGNLLLMVNDEILNTEIVEQLSIILIGLRKATTQTLSPGDSITF